MQSVGIDSKSPNLFSASLEALGFDRAFQDSFAALAAPDEVPGRVCAVHRGLYRVLTGARATEGGGGMEELDARPTGRLGHLALTQAELPAVGDWVLLRRGEDQGSVLVTGLLPRRNTFARKVPGPRQEAQVLAANVDYALVVTACGQDFSLRRMERFVALAEEAGVRPLLVLTKIDLEPDIGPLLAEVEALSPVSPVLAVCAPEGLGLSELGTLLGPRVTAVLLGSSGAGKSTLLNALAGSALADTGEVRLDDEKGRHTTTSRELYLLPSGALLIDTPGLREVQLWADEEAVDASFAEIEELSAACRFRDCRHEGEPGCAVGAALEAGTLDRRRYASWLKLRREVAHLERKDDAALQRAEAERWKSINKSMRGYTKERRSLQGKAR